MLSQYNHKVDSSKAKKMETKAGNTTRYESGSTDYSNKENRYDYTSQIWLGYLICRRYKEALLHLEIHVVACYLTIKTALVSLTK